MDTKSKLIAAATAYDRQQAKSKHYNPHALGQIFEAVDRACELIAAGASPRAALLRCFLDRLLDRMLKAIGEPPATVEEVRTRLSAAASPRRHPQQLVLLAVPPSPEGLAKTSVEANLLRYSAGLALTCPRCHDIADWRRWVLTTWHGTPEGESKEVVTMSRSCCGSCAGSREDAQKHLDAMISKNKRLAACGLRIEIIDGRDSRFDDLDSFDNSPTSVPIRHATNPPA